MAPAKCKDALSLLVNMPFAVARLEIDIGPSDAFARRQKSPFLTVAIINQLSFPTSIGLPPLFQLSWETLRDSGPLPIKRMFGLFRERTPARNPYQSKNSLHLYDLIISLPTGSVCDQSLSVSGL